VAHTHFIAQLITQSAAEPDDQDSELIVCDSSGAGIHKEKTPLKQGSNSFATCGD